MQDEELEPKEDAELDEEMDNDDLEDFKDEALEEDETM